MLYPAELRARGRRHSDSKAYAAVPKIKSTSFSRYCARTLVDGQVLAQRARHFAGFAIEFSQGFSFHLQLHLRVLLEDLGITLPRHLCDPLVRYAACTQAGGMRHQLLVLIGGR
jgi:hypothetical protein